MLWALTTTLAVGLLSALSKAQTNSTEARALKILTDVPLLDGHNDLPILVRETYNNHINGEDFNGPFTKGGTTGQLDLPRIRKGKYGGAFWSVFVLCPENVTDFSDANYVDSFQQTHEQIDLINRLLEKYDGDFRGHLTSQEAIAAHKQGKIVSPLGIEGLHSIRNRASNLRNFYNLGVRYASLNHNCGNKYADSALWHSPTRVASPIHNGISVAGQHLIDEMNRIGMIVDLSHSSEKSQIDVLVGKDGWKGSAAPVMFSHSGVYSICPHPRNVKDSVLQLVQQRNSIVMINFAGEFVSCTPNSDPNKLPDPYPQNATLAQVADHIMHIGRLIGYDHVGIGTDYDGIEDDVPRGLEDVSKFPALVAELLRRGVSDTDVEKIIGRNILRVWGEAENVARRLQEQGTPPLED